MRRTQGQYTNTPARINATLNHWISNYTISENLYRVIGFDETTYRTGKLGVPLGVWGLGVSTYMLPLRGLRVRVCVVIYTYRYWICEHVLGGTMVGAVGKPRRPGLFSFPFFDRFRIEVAIRKSFLWES